MIMSDHLAAQTAEDLRRWNESGLPRHWVEVRNGAWNHGDWLRLVDQLRGSEYWPLELAEVGRVLNGLAVEWRNLRRWQDSGWPRQWVEVRNGAWCHGDWLALVDQLRGSEYWPLELAEVGRVLNGLAVEWRNLRRWQDSGAPRQWVEDQDGQWGQAEWQHLVETLRQSAFWPINLGTVGRVLEELKLAFWNLRRWRDSGLARRWVAANGGRWDHAARLALLDALQKSEFWPIDTVALAKVLEQIRLEPANLRRWVESGAARRWLESRKGPWGEADWQKLLAQLRQSEFWPLDAVAARRRLQELGMGRASPDHWRVRSLARRWVEAQQGEWSEEWWRALLSYLEAHQFGPVDSTLLRRVLEEVRADWWRIRPWLHGAGDLAGTANKATAEQELCRSLMDVRMPGLDGFETAVAFHEQET
jgi:hypothetical protein